MIFGIGTDMVEIRRVERVYQRFGEHFVKRLLMHEEELAFRATTNPVRFLAMRFAAKEAVAKALGTGFSSGIWIRDIGVRPDARGKPCVIFSARGAAVCRRMGAGEGFVSLTDEAGLIVAFAVLMKS